MKGLHKKAIAGLVNLFVVMAAVLFLSAWTLSYWQGWILLGAFFVPSLAITFYLMRNDAKLLERRVHAGAASEKEKKQKVIQVFAGLAFIAVLALPGIDRRFGWSEVPVYFVIAGDIMVLLGFLVIYKVFKVNTFTSGIIEVVSEQKVVSTGPYAVVRHPMYSGALVMLLAVPLALGSWWGLLTFIPMTIVIVVRLMDEEQFLTKNLAGYSEYRDRVRYRLAPFVW
jgi:protein-S-isoprenylcysteine O-methyltransferase Ste14